MKIYISVLFVVLTSFAYWLGYHTGTQSRFETVVEMHDKILPASLEDSSYQRWLGETKAYLDIMKAFIK